MISAATGYFSQLTERIGAAWNRFWFAPADPAPLGLVRLLTGCVAIYWYLTLAPDWERFFGPGGLLPPEAIREVEGPLASAEWSYLNLISSGRELWAAYALGLVPLAALALGLYTWAAAPLALVVTLATIHRAGPITGPVEPLLALVMLYLAIGPSGARFSLDALRAKLAAAAAPARPTVWAGVVTKAFQVHLAMLYACMGLSKLYAGAWWTGTGVWWLMTRAESRMVDLTWLHAHPFVVNFWSHATVATELAFALLIWLRIARPLLLALAAVMWILLTLLTGQVTFLCMILAANMIFAPAEAMASCCRKSGSA